jgi:hypothetical protein
MNLACFEVHNNIKINTVLRCTKKFFIRLLKLKFNNDLALNI